MFLDMTQAFKAGEEACLAGVAFNRNPYMHKKDIINKTKASAWSKGFAKQERSCRGA